MDWVEFYHVLGRAFALLPTTVIPHCPLAPDSPIFRLYQYFIVDITIIDPDSLDLGWDFNSYRIQFFFL